MKIETLKQAVALITSWKIEASQNNRCSGDAKVLDKVLDLLRELPHEGS